MPWAVCALGIGHEPITTKANPEILDRTRPHRIRMSPWVKVAPRGKEASNVLQMSRAVESGHDMC